MPAMPSAEAIRRAGLKPTDIDHVNAHATGTTFGDLAEARAIRNALGSHAPAVYAPKAALGHSFGSRGRGGGGADGAGPARRGHPADAQSARPWTPRSTWTWWPALRGVVITGMRSPIRLPSVDIMWR